MKLQTVENDSGLWGVYDGQQMVGAIFDRGAAKSKIKRT